MTTDINTQVSAMLETLKAAGLDTQAITDMQLANAFETALASTEERWATVESAIVSALPELVGDFEAFQAIEITRNGDNWTVERKVASARKNGGGKGSPKPCTVSPEHQQKFGVGGYHRSVRQLSHALARAQGNDTPPDNGTGTYIRKHAPELADALLADGHRLT